MRTANGSSSIDAAKVILVFLTLRRNAKFVKVRQSSSKYFLYSVDNKEEKIFSIFLPFLPLFTFAHRSLLIAHCSLLIAAYDYAYDYTFAHTLLSHSRCS